MARAAGALVLLAAAACARAPAPPAAADLPVPAPPAGCTSVPPGAELQPLLAAAAPGSAFCLGPGVHRGPASVPPGVRLHGGRDAVVRTSGSGSTVRLAGRGARLTGLVVDGSGGRFDTLDAAVVVEADDAAVEGVLVRNAVFGILVHRSRRVVLRGNDVRGVGGAAMGLRGDGIRLWETHDSLVERNRVRSARDLVIWYSGGNRLLDNVVADGRYGAHLMYSHDNVVAGNRFERNVVGVFVMYSRNARLERNLLAASSGAAGLGLGLKDSGNVEVAHNRLVGNATGVFLDTSPDREGDVNRFTGNLLRGGDAALVFHGSERRNEFRDNRFRDVRAVARVEGGGDALGCLFEGNDFDDYAGYDLDGDGWGDLPYEVRSATGTLLGRRPEVAFFRGLPVLWLVDAVGRALPLLQPKALLRDPRPRLAGSAPAAGEVLLAR